MGSPQEAPGGVRSKLAFVATRPVAISMFIIALTVFGFVSLSKLPVDLLPEISYPTLTVRSAYPGAAPEDVEDRVSERVQEALSTLPSLVRSTSISRAGYSDVLLEFAWGTNMTFAVQEVRDRLDDVFLPDDAERPLILRYDPNLDPILRVGLRAPEGRAEQVEGFDAESLIRLRWLAENRIKRQLEGLDGVAAIQVRGGLQEEILVSVDPAQLAALNLDPALIGQRLAAENLNASSGQVREGSTDYLVRTLNEFRTVEEIEGLALVKREGAILRVRDVATVTRTYAERDVITRIKGAEAVEVAIFREAGANIVAVAQAVRDALFGDEEQAALMAKLVEQDRTRSDELSFMDRRKLSFLGWELRDEAQLETLSDQSTFIGAAVDDVRDAAGLGALLAVLVMWIFLRRVAPTLIIGLAIPISVVVTFAPMFLMDVSLNIMSLGGLALGVGMLVDNAIVVLESITRCREEGDPLGDAAVRGTSEVVGAIVASTLTTVAVFAPIVFVHGIAGQIFGDQAVTVVSALLVSLLVAVLFIPMLASRPWLGTEKTAKELYAWATPRDLPARISAFVRTHIFSGLRFRPATLLEDLVRLFLRIVWAGGFVMMRGLMLLMLIPAALVALLGLVRKLTFDVAWTGLERLYPRVLQLALAQPVLVAIGVGLLSWGAWQRLGGLGLELLPEIHQGEFTAFVTLEDGTPIEESDLVFSELDRSLGSLPGVAATALTVGVEEDTLTSEIEGEHTARLTVRLTPEASSPAREMQLETAVRERIESHPAVARPPTFRRPTPFTLEAPVAVEVRGWDLDVLAEVSAQVAERLRGVEGLADVRTSVREGHPEAQVVFDRDKTLEYGLDLGEVSTFVRDQVLGKVDTRFVEGDERIDVRVRADREVLASVQDVYSMIINPTADQPVPLEAVATIESVRGPAEIRRIGNTRAVLVTASTTGLDLGSVGERIGEALETLSYPADVVVEQGGQKRELEAGTRSLQLALLLAVFLVYVVMATQFESLLQPFIILFSVPLAGVGVVYALDLLGTPLSVVVFIGLILLAGIVVNNAIVLVDRINQQRAAGQPLNDAILEAGRARLRPILMTTATTVLGLLPLTGWLGGVPLIGQLGAGEGTELRAPMAVTVITGLIASTVLTLVVIPVIYRLVTREEAKPA